LRGSAASIAAALFRTAQVHEHAVADVDRVLGYTGTENYSSSAEAIASDLRIEAAERQVVDRQSARRDGVAMPPLRQRNRRPASATW